MGDAYELTKFLPCPLTLDAVDKCAAMLRTGAEIVHTLRVMQAVGARIEDPIAAVARALAAVVTDATRLESVARVVVESTMGPPLPTGGSYVMRVAKAAGWTLTTLAVTG